MAWAAGSARERAAGGGHRSRPSLVVAKGISRGRAFCKHAGSVPGEVPERPRSNSFPLLSGSARRPPCPPPRNPSPRRKARADHRRGDGACPGRGDIRWAEPPARRGDGGEPGAGGARKATETGGARQGRAKHSTALPQAPDAVGVEQGLVRDELEVGAQGLGDEHPVEWVAVRAGQAPRPLRVVERDGEFREPLGGDAGGDVTGDLGGAGKLAEAVLGGDLPGRARGSPARGWQRRRWRRARAGGRRSSPSSHQRSAWVSRRREAKGAPLLPGGELVVGEGLEEGARSSRRGPSWPRTGAAAPGRRGARCGLPAGRRGRARPPRRPRHRRRASRAGSWPGGC